MLVRRQGQTQSTCVTQNTLCSSTGRAQGVRASSKATMICLLIKTSSNGVDFMEGAKKCYWCLSNASVYLPAAVPKKEISEIDRQQKQYSLITGKGWHHR